jgi:hypothetical protein
LPQDIEQVLIDGDLSKLSVERRLFYYNYRCRSAGLDPACRPFAFIKARDSGKTILYALKECSEQLNALHGISHKATGIKDDTERGVYEVGVTATMANGRETFELGVTSTDKLRGELLANAKMKAVTKAKRRATLSLCGLGDMPDETELETMEVSELKKDNGQPLMPANQSGHASGAYGSPEQVDKWLKVLHSYVDRRCQGWLDRWQQKDGSFPPGCDRELCRVYQVDNHLIKWAVQTGRLEHRSLDEHSGKARGTLGQLTSVLNAREGDREPLRSELIRYIDEQERLLTDKIRRYSPHLFDDDKYDETETTITQEKTNG